MSEALKEGWAYPSTTGAPHFFGTDRRSLCGRWAFFGTLEADDGVARRYDCKVCRKKLLKRNTAPPMSNANNEEK